LDVNAEETSHTMLMYVLESLATESCIGPLWTNPTFFPMVGMIREVLHLIDVLPHFVLWRVIGATPHMNPTWQFIIFC